MNKLRKYIREQIYTVLNEESENVSPEEREILAQNAKKERDRIAYKRFFSKALAKFGVSTVNSLPDDKKQEFFNYVDQNWSAQSSQTTEGLSTDTHSIPTKIPEKLVKSLKSLGIEFSVELFEDEYTIMLYSEFPLLYADDTYMLLNKRHTVVYETKILEDFVRWLHKNKNNLLTVLNANNKMRVGESLKLNELWKGKLQKNYDDDYEQFVSYDSIYNIANRLGFKSAKEAWELNPTIQVGVNPEDLKVIDETSSTGGVEGYMTPGAFSGQKGISKKQKSIANQLGYELVDKSYANKSEGNPEDLTEGMDSFYFKDENLTNEQKLGLSIRSIRNSLMEVEKLVQKSIKLKTENNIDTDKMGKRAYASLRRINEKVVRLMVALNGLK